MGLKDSKSMENYLSDIFALYPGATRENLIPILIKVQEAKGFISEEAIVSTGEYLSISCAKIYSLATFYDEFRFRMRGENHFMVCCGATCWMRGSEVIRDLIKDETGVSPGGVSNDSRWSLELTSCRGTCHNGPLVLLNEKPIVFKNDVDPVARVREIIKKIKDE